MSSKRTSEMAAIRAAWSSAVRIAGASLGIGRKVGHGHDQRGLRIVLGGQMEERHRPSDVEMDEIRRERPLDCGEPQFAPQDGACVSPVEPEVEGQAMDRRAPVAGLVRQRQAPVRDDNRVHVSARRQALDES